MKTFTFYRTFVPDLPKTVPVTVGVEYVRPSLLRAVQDFEHVFLHSGNWWRLSESERTPRKIYSAYRVLSRACRVEGVMSTNVPPTRVRPRYDIWNYPSEVRREALERSLRYAEELRNLMGEEADLIYCSFEVGTFEDAVEYYRRALEMGFRRFGMGAAAFLMGTGTSFEPYKHIVDVVVGARLVLGEEYPFHVSGVGSLKLIPILYYLGVTSCDGSTPIRAALSMGIVYDVRGRQYRVRELREWRCECPVCSGRSPREAAELLQRDYRARVLHNSYVWDQVLEAMVRADQEGRLEEFVEQCVRESPLMRKVFEYARSLVRKYFRT